MNDKINQDSINKALWNACDTFRGTISADTYKDFILTMLFLKYISDVWQDHYDGYKAEYGTRFRTLLDFTVVSFVATTGVKRKSQFNRFRKVLVRQGLH